MDYLATAVVQLPKLSSLGVAESITIDGWFFAVAGGIVSIVALATTVLVAIWRNLVMRRDYEKDQQARDTRCASCERALKDHIDHANALFEEMVTREKLEDTLKPVLETQRAQHEELEHRKRSMNKLGETVVRMDKKLTALLVAMKVDVSKLDLGANGGSREEE